MNNLRNVIISTVLIIASSSARAHVANGEIALAHIHHSARDSISWPEVQIAATNHFHSLSFNEKARDDDHNPRQGLKNYLALAHERFNAANTDHDGSLTVRELNSRNGHKLLNMIKTDN